MITNTNNQEATVVETEEKDTRPRRYRNVQFMVEATDFEERVLREKWQDRISWASLSMEHVEVGTYHRRPVAIRVRWVKLNGCKVGFYDARSPLVDHNKINAWLKQNYLPPRKGDDGTVRANAENFHLCIEAITPKPHRKRR